MINILLKIKTYMATSSLEILPYILGYLFAIFIAGFPIRLIMDKIWRDLGADNLNNDQIRPRPWHP